MRKQLTVLIAALLFALGLGAQDGGNPIIVVSTKGAVLYSSPSIKKKMPVKPGAALVAEGKLSLAAGASVLLCHRGQFQSIAKKGTVALADVFDADSEPGIDFDADFAKYVEAAVETEIYQRNMYGWTNPVSDPKKSGDGWGAGVRDPNKPPGDGWGAGVRDPNKPPGDGWGAGVRDPNKPPGDGWGAGVRDPNKPPGDGWGGKGESIFPILPFGNLQTGKTTFRWSKPAGVTAYQLDIKDEADKTINTVTVKDTFATIVLDSVRFSLGRKFSWMITASNKSDLISSPRIFTITAKSDMNRALQQAKDSQIRSDGDVLLQGMMDAVALELNGWYTEAAGKYATLTRQNPRNNMLRLMHATFWMRYRLPTLSKAILNGKL